MPIHRWLGRITPAVVLTASALMGETVLAQHTWRVSVDSSGVQGNDDSQQPSTSDDGRFLAFRSEASNLVTADTNGVSDVFLHDRQSAITMRVSVSSAGLEGDGASYWPHISSNGRFVAFGSTATNLVPVDTNAAQDVFVRDLHTGTTTMVSVDSTGQQGNADSFSPAISGDGRYVAFSSDATYLVPGDHNGAADIFLHDRHSGTTTRVSVDSSGVEGDSDSWAPSISKTGGFVAYESRASNLVPGDTNGWQDIFVHQLQTGLTTRVSVDSSGVEPNQTSYRPSISGDGSLVAFHSWATDLVPGDTNSREDVFVHDRQSATTTRVSVSSKGRQGDGNSTSPSISEDGRMVAFHSAATNLVPKDNNKSTDVFIHDRTSMKTRRLSVSSAEEEANGTSSYPFVSADGRFVAFESNASNLVKGDSNRDEDIFVRGPHLILEAVPETAPPGVPLTLTTWGGAPSAPVLLAAVNINGSPTFINLATGLFDSSGLWLVSGTVPPALSGSVITFTGFGTTPDGKVDLSNREVVTFS